jgi:hypothetical protein
MQDIIELNQKQISEKKSEIGFDMMKIDSETEKQIKTLRKKAEVEGFEKFYEKSVEESAESVMKKLEEKLTAKMENCCCKCDPENMTEKQKQEVAIEVEKVLKEIENNSTLNPEQKKALINKVFLAKAAIGLVFLASAAYLAPAVIGGLGMAFKAGLTKVGLTAAGKPIMAGATAFAKSIPLNYGGFSFIANGPFGSIFMPTTKAAIGTAHITAGAVGTGLAATAETLRRKLNKK